MPEYLLDFACARPLATWSHIFHLTARDAAAAKSAQVFDNPHIVTGGDVLLIYVILALLPFHQR
jgi:hypothetical protein